MSINLYCKLVVPGKDSEDIPLVQTPSDVTDYALYTCVERVTERRPGQKRADAKRRERVPRSSWQEIARVYLAWVESQYGRRGARHWSPDVVKAQRRAIGRAWRTAEECGGRLAFSGW